MSNMIRNFVVSIIALVFVYICARAAFMVLLIVWNLARRILRGL
jgi:hypothetical protein